MQEALREFGESREVACIVSIGTGRPDVGGFKPPRLFQRLMPTDLISVLKCIATDSEYEARKMEAKYKNCPELYHRLNVDRGLEKVFLGEWEKLGEIAQHTLAYLGSPRVGDRVDVIVRALLRKSPIAYRLDDLGK